MGDVIKAFRRSKVLSIGFLMIVLALILSAVASFTVENKSYVQSGKLGPGKHVIGSDNFEGKYLYPNRTLVLSSNNTTLILVSSDKNISYNLTGRIVLHPKERPTIVVYNGSVGYTYRVRAVNYPYSDLSIPALILALIGSVFLWVGYAKIIREVREGKKNEKD
ncbi:hypothetical protein [Thermococcus sp.]